MLAGDPQFRERFDREARAISQLDHPNICALFDTGQQDGTSYLVMHFLEGETLADRLTRGPVPLEQALTIAVQIAGALVSAHRAGIVHRDLKPGNVMLTKTGAKLLDFGLAKSGASMIAGAGGSMLPTTPAALTAQGTILGTFQYMAPEQLEGEEADARSDIFAFGALLHEMVTGKKAFDGKSHASLVAAILERQPPTVSSLQPTAPAALDRVVTKCLAKDPDDRWQSAKDLKDALAWLNAEPPSGSLVASAIAPASVKKQRHGWIAWAVAVVFVGVLAGVSGWAWRGRSVRPPLKVSFDITTETAPSPLHIALSPDGSRLAAIVAGADGQQLWLRRLDEVTGQTIVGSTNAAFPFWSPDAKFIAYFTPGKLYKVDVVGGPPQPLCDAPGGRGGTWNREGVIVFAPTSSGPLFKVSAAGGLPTPLTTLDQSRGDTAHRHPKFLPDGRHFLFYVSSPKTQFAGLYVGSIDSKEVRRLVASDAMGVFAPPDRLLFMRDTTIMAQRFDPDRLQLSGDPAPVAADAGINTGNSVSGIAVSDTGTLAYRIGGSITRRVLRWVDRTGKQLDDVGGVGPHQNARLSPLGDRLAEARGDGTTGNIWTMDLQRGATSRFTFDPGLENNPVWSSDGSRIAFSSSHGNGDILDLYSKNAGGAGEPELLLKTSSVKHATDWSNDGRYIAYTQVTNSTDLWVLPLFGDKKPIPFLVTSFNETLARFSPDGHWIAYTSDESGIPQVYVQHFPANGSKWQVSTTGGAEPHWRGDGRELYYRSAGSLRAVDVSASDVDFKSGVPQKLFDLHGAAGGLLDSAFDVTTDGQRFLLNENSVLANGVPPIRVIVNWMTSLP